MNDHIDGEEQYIKWDLRLVFLFSRNEIECEGWDEMRCW